MTRSPASPAVGRDGAVLRASLERLEAATGPDPIIDLLLARATGHQFVREDGSPSFIDNGVVCGDFLLSHEHAPAREEIARDMRLPRFTASLDAVVALVERVLPGWSFLMAWNGQRGIANVHVAPLGTNQAWARAGEAPTPALALCIALVRALLTRDEMESDHAHHG